MPYSLFTRSALRSRSHKFMALLVAFALVFDLASGAAWNVPVAFAHDSGEPHEEEFQGSQKGQQDGDGEEDEGAPFEEEQDSSENCGNSGTSGEGCDEQGNSGDNEGDDRGVTEEKVTICHLPPGNPENAQGITISVNAAQLPGHLQHGDSVGSCEVPPPTTDTGTIRICKVIASEDGVLATSSDGLPGGSFSVGLSYGFTPSSAMPYATATWSTMSFMPDTDLIGHDGVNDAVCVSYGALPIGSYYYDEEFLSGDGEWLAPKYNDQYTHPFDDLSDLFAYSPALFTADPSDDNAREQNADGHIVLSKNQTRTLVVLNTYGDEDVPPPPPTPVCGNGVIEPLIGESCDDGNLISGDGCSNQCRVEPIVPPASCSLTLVSDTSNIVVGGGNAVATYDDNPAWTAMIPGATWIWKTFFVSTPSINETTIFEKAFAIDRPVATATLAIAADNSYEITLNGTPFAADLGEYNYRESGKDIYDFASALASGTNTLRISVKNWGIPGSSAQSNPAGLLYRLEVAYGGQGCVDTPPPVCSDDLDNDGDGIADFPTDPGCDTPTDNDENEKPVITVLGDNPMDILLGATFTDPGATAADPEDGNITSSIVATGTVNTLAIGTYTITYTVSDSDGLAADPKTRTVRVVQAPVCSDGVDNDGDAHSDFPTDPGCDTPTDNDENEKPMITVLGADPMTLTLGSTFTDPSATVADPEDGDITAKLVTTGTVNTGIVGSYTLTYNATDSDNMAADPKTRTVIVATVCSDGRDNDGDGKADFPLDPGCGDPTDDSENTPPVVTLLGATPISVIVGTLFTDPGATALDLEDGTLTPSVSGSVNTSVIGAYLLTYGAMDSDGATATPVMRTVNVIPEPTVPPVCSDDLDNDGDGIADFPTDLGCDTPTDNDENEKPVITVLGDNPMDILLGATFTDPG
ncbi:MAG TPA: immunoglobulin-like domain-containing protein, partial [Candidatus Paceibacterota bacterium]|nr:immunoglobulin-like domain-containing protein [Candidatus Paceibacterota bacterium]